MSPRLVPEPAPGASVSVPLRALLGLVGGSSAEGDPNGTPDDIADAALREIGRRLDSLGGELRHLGEPATAESVEALAIMAHAAADLGPQLRGRQASR